MSDPTPSHVAPVAPGAVLAGKYRVERIIGQGGMGLVVLARHIALEDLVALKFLLPDHASRPDAADRFLREAQAARKIKSEHVARVADVGTLESGAPYMVMEFLEGDDLAKIVRTSGKFEVAEAVDYVLQACEAIAEAHGRGIVHRDLKPANLFLSKRLDGSPIVKVLDFGISKDMREGVPVLTNTTAALGSALYMSPEQMQQTRSVDHRTDIYALGISLYELIGGKQPYHAETLPELCAAVLTGTPTPLRDLRPEVPEELAKVLEKAYARDRGSRYQTIADFVVALAPFAPSRSQTTIERVARMAGLPIPPARGSSPGGLASEPSTPDLAPRPTPPGIQPPSAAVPIQEVQDDSPPPIRPGSEPNQIIPGHYSGPMSSRAAALFAQGHTETALATARRPPGGPGRAGTIVAVVIAILALFGVAMAFALRGAPSEHGSLPPRGVDIPLPPPTPKATEPTVPPTVQVEPPAPTEAPKATDTAPPPPASAVPGAGTKKGGVKPLPNPGSAAAPTAKPDLYGKSH